MKKEYRVPTWSVRDEMAEFIRSQKGKHVTIAAYMRHLVEEDMKKAERKERRKAK